MRASLEFDEDESCKRLSVLSNEDVRTGRSYMAVLHLVKGNCGPGILALPLRFALVGLPTGLACLAGVVAHSFYGIWLLLKLQMRLDEEQPLKISRSLEDVGFAALGVAGRIVTQLTITFAQVGVCIIHISFLTVSVCAAFSSLSYYLVLALVTICCGCLALLPNLEKLSPFSLFGSMVMVTAATTVVAVSITEMINPTSLSTALPAQAGNSANPKHAHSETPLSFLASIFFAFEGIALVLPIRNSLSPHVVGSFPKIFYSTMSFVAVIFALLGSTGATTFTKIDTASVVVFVLHNCDKESRMGAYLFVLNALVALAVLFTYPLQLMPVGEVLCSIFDIRRRHKKAAFRVLCTGISAVIVAVLPSLGVLIKLSGAIAFTTLGALPFMFHGAYTWSNRRCEPKTWILLVLIDFFAVVPCAVVMVVGVQSAFEEISTPVE